jgi:hypothetical protein
MGANAYEVTLFFYSVRIYSVANVTQISENQPKYIVRH